MERVNAVVHAAESDYLLHGLGMALHAIPQTADIGGILSADVMKRVYAQTFVKSVSTRPFYHAIKAVPANDICPLCSQRTVSTLDHYLPQSLHAALTIVPLNLVPACAECNKSKLARQPAAVADQSFHPYFDNFDDGQWLIAEVVIGDPAAVRFHVTAPEGWSAVKVQRARNHFDVLKLGPLYASHAGVELANMRYSLERIAHSGTSHDVRAWLTDRAESARQVALNSWQHAMLEALAASDWFCDGGFTD
ncbi:HNH endonuclease [Novosphingobium sp. TCA1]|uniref:HNH endonuclease n=1 Tax=Novosphingobium sp. TCA1 TaxID=2682474 RepID=UPI00130B0DFC|nr:hypothetical protein [Novosphingobium sp. TCA1]GFE77934.1 HNH endonuclease [Novosphingobium sp. TCA1]